MFDNARDHLLRFLACTVVLCWLIAGIAQANSAEDITEGLVILTPVEGQIFHRSHIRVVAFTELGVILQLQRNGEMVETAQAVLPSEFGLESPAPTLKGAWGFYNIELSAGPNTYWCDSHQW